MIKAPQYYTIKKRWLTVFLISIESATKALSLSRNSFFNLLNHSWSSALKSRDLIVAIICSLLKELNHHRALPLQPPPKLHRPLPLPLKDLSHFWQNHFFFFFERQLQYAVNTATLTLYPLNLQAFCIWRSVNSATMHLSFLDFFSS